MYYAIEIFFWIVKLAMCVFDIANEMVAIIFCNYWSCYGVEYNNRYIDVDIMRHYDVAWKF